MSDENVKFTVFKLAGYLDKLTTEVFECLQECCLYYHKSGKKIYDVFYINAVSRGLSSSMDLYLRPDFAENECFFKISEDYQSEPFAIIGRDGYVCDEE